MAQLIPQLQGGILNYFMSNNISDSCLAAIGNTYFNSLKLLWASFYDIKNAVSSCTHIASVMENICSVHSSNFF